jgi:adenylyltransferase/sulfurtransferase
LGSGAGLEGAGYQFNGTSHDSYVVRYERRKDCLAHDTYDLTASETASAETTLGTILDRAREELGSTAVLDLEHDIALRAQCGECGQARDLLRPLSSLAPGSGICPECGREWRLEFAHSIAPDDTIAQLTASQIGLPPADIVTARAGEKRLHYRLTGEGSALEFLRSVDGATAASAS